MAKRHCIDLTGQRFGRWAAVRQGEQRDRRVHWWCHCDCGTDRLIPARSLLSGRTQSCGCRKSGLLSSRNTTHGLSGFPEHVVWKSMMTRCFNANTKNYADYGGRGITVCDRWRGPQGFANFLADVGPRQSPHHTIDRIENDGNYEPGNCRWATDEIQRRNKRSNVVLEHDGLRLTLSDWAERTGLDRNTIISRIRKLEWSVQRALTTPARPRGH